MYIFLIFDKYFYNKFNNKCLMFFKLLFLTTIINHIILYIFIGNINISYKMLTITPFFLIKYIIMTVLTSLFIVESYKFKNNNLVLEKNIDINRPKLLKTDILILIVSFIIFSLLYFVNYYSSIPVEQLVFHLQVPIEGTSSSIILDFLSKTLSISFSIIIILHIHYYVVKQGNTLYSIAKTLCCKTIKNKIICKI